MGGRVGLGKVGRGVVGTGGTTLGKSGTGGRSAVVGDGNLSTTFRSVGGVPEVLCGR